MNVEFMTNKKDRVGLPVIIKTTIHGMDIFASMFENSKNIQFSSSHKSYSNLTAALNYAAQLSGKPLRNTDAADTKWFINTSMGEQSVFALKNNLQKLDDKCLPSFESAPITHVKIAASVDDTHAISHKDVLGKRRSRDDTRQKKKAKLNSQKSVWKDKVDKKKDEQSDDDDMDEPFTWTPSNDKSEWNAADLSRFLHSNPSQAPTLLDITDVKKTHPVYSNRLYNCVFEHPDNSKVVLYISETIMEIIPEYKQKKDAFWTNRITKDFQEI